jgi:hypothetical protein
MYLTYCEPCFEITYRYSNPRKTGIPLLEITFLLTLLRRTKPIRYSPSKSPEILLVENIRSSSRCVASEPLKLADKVSDSSLAVRVEIGSCLAKNSNASRNSIHPTNSRTNYIILPFTSRSCHSSDRLSAQEKPIT